MTLTEFICDTLVEVLQEDKPMARKISSSTPKTKTVTKKSSKKRLISEQMVIEAFENGCTLEIGENDILSPLAKDALTKYQLSK